MKLFIYSLCGFLLIKLFALEEREISCSSVAMNAFLPWWCSESLWKMKSWFGRCFPHEDSPAVELWPREAGPSPPLRGFMPWLCKALSSWVWSHCWAFPGQGLVLETPTGPHQTGVSYGFLEYNLLPQVCRWQCNPEGWQFGRQLWFLFMAVTLSVVMSEAVYMCEGLDSIKLIFTRCHILLVLYPPPYPNHGLSKNKGVFICWWMIKLMSVGWDYQSAKAVS